MRAFINLICLVVLLVFGYQTGARANLIVYSDPTTWSSQNGFSGDQNGGQAAWSAQLGAAAQPFTGTAVRTDSSWQCVTQSCPGTGLAYFTSTQTLSGLGDFTIRFDPFANQATCAFSTEGDKGCTGTFSATFVLSNYVVAFGSTVTLFSTIMNHVVNFDGIPIDQFPPDTLGNTGYATLFFGVISDTPFNSFTISGDGSLNDDFFSATFNNIQIAVDEPPALPLFAAGLIVLMIGSYAGRVVRLLH